MSINIDRASGSGDRRRNGTFEHYSYADDAWLNRELGEPYDFDWAGALRVKTFRWRWQRFVYKWGR